MSNEFPISICLWFDNSAEEAARFYTSLVPNSEILSVSPIIVHFTIGGVSFQALNGGPKFHHSEAASIVVTTENQEETDRLWNTLIADGGSESQCGWLKDRFGVSWQIIPKILPELIFSPDQISANRAIQAMFKMRKIDIQTVVSAFNTPEHE